jgi:hypothetical protein
LELPREINGALVQWVAGCLSAGCVLRPRWWRQLTMKRFSLIFQQFASATWQFVTRFIHFYLAPASLQSFLSVLHLAFSAPAGQKHRRALIKTFSTILIREKTSKFRANVVCALFSRGSHFRPGQKLLAISSPSLIKIKQRRTKSVLCALTCCAFPSTVVPSSIQRRSEYFFIRPKIHAERKLSRRKSGCGRVIINSLHPTPLRSVSFDL